MDKLQKIALNYKSLLDKYYIFEIARKQKIVQFMLTFDKADLNHLMGLHKLTDIAGLQSEHRKSKIFDRILKGDISEELIKRSRFYDKIYVRLDYLEKLEDILDSNQIIFKYMEKSNQISRIEADYLLQNAHQTDIIYIFLSERAKTEQTAFPVMCCRSFFPMDKLDYTKNQPSYTLLKKIKVDAITGEKTVQYDRSRILAQAKQAASEPERRSIMQRLNEKKAQMAINEVLAEKNREKNKHEHERF
ncbi:MAG: hypothetical protein K2L82_11185 [Lachnospiraceae bacterium]|nr:hypothetical protein [Lachnospiraceae bacterium]